MKQPFYKNIRLLPLVAIIGCFIVCIVASCAIAPNMGNHSGGWNSSGGTIYICNGCGGATIGTNGYHNSGYCYNCYYGNNGGSTTYYCDDCGMDMGTTNGYRNSGYCYDCYYDNNGSGGGSVSVTGISLSQSNLYLSEGERATLTATVSPSNASNRAVTWSSNVPSVATVSSNGTVTAISAGTATVTVITDDGDYTASCVVTVTQPVSSVLISQSNLYLNKGESAMLTATVLPSDASNRAVTWSSSVPSVATVSSNGTVTAISAGTATVTVITDDGDYTASCVVTVTEAIIGTAGLVYEETAEGYNVLGYTGTDSAVVIPHSYQGKPVLGIANNAFQNKTITSVYIGNNVTSIGSSAFYYCDSLTSVTIGNSVTSIGYFAFKYCSGLTKVNYTGTIDSWVMIGFDGEAANPLYYARKLYLNDVEVTQVYLTTATKISQYAFINLNNLTSVTIGNNVTSIGFSAFDGCSGLTSVTFLNPNGWSAGSTSLTSGNLSNASIAAMYLTNTYYSSTWKRT